MVALSQRSARIQNDPDQYIRPVKGGRFQARPYCSIEHRRYDLGLFDTRHAARTAIAEFWRGQRPALLRGTRRIKTGGTVKYAAIAVVDGERVSLHRLFDTREAAFRALLDCVREKFKRHPLMAFLLTAKLSEV
jgi:hypothetical protein